MFAYSFSCVAPDLASRTHVMAHDHHNHTPEGRPLVAADEAEDFRLETAEAEPGLNVLDDEDPATDGADVLPTAGPVPAAARVHRPRGEESTGERPLPGASPERQREYEELKTEFQEEGRYKGREEEVAARIVNKQRSEFGETAAEQEKEAWGLAPDRHLAIPNYRHLSVGEVVAKARGLSEEQLKEIRKFELKHRNRKTLLAQLDKIMKGGGRSRDE